MKKWYSKYLQVYEKPFSYAPAAVVEEVRGKLAGSWRIGTTGKDVFHWWMEDGVLPGQMEFSDLADYEEEYEIE